MKLKRLEAQTRVICTFNRIIFAVMGLILGMAVVASALPQKRNRDDLRYRLERTLEEEKNVLAEKEHREIEYKAMKEDTAFLELKAMDRLNLHQEGQRIYRFKKAGD